MWGLKFGHAWNFVKMCSGKAHSGKVHLGKTRNALEPGLRPDG